MNFKMWIPIQLFRISLISHIVSFLAPHVVSEFNSKYLDGMNSGTSTIYSLQSKDPVKSSVSFTGNYPNTLQSGATSTSTSSISQSILTDVAESSNNVQHEITSNAYGNSLQMIIPNTFSDNASRGSGSTNYASTSANFASETLPSSSSSSARAISVSASASSASARAGSASESEGSASESTSSISASKHFDSFNMTYVPNIDNPALRSVIGNAQNTATVPSTFAPVLPVKEETNEYSFAKAALSLPIIQKFLNVQISSIEAETIFFSISDRILNDSGYPRPKALANEISQIVVGIDTLTLPIYFLIVDKTLRQFLLTEGIEVTSILPQNYAKILKDVVTLSDITDKVSLYNALTNGLAQFISSLGFDIAEKADELTVFLRSAFQSYFFYWVN